jgi:glycosyltransferase involved in cell wall biosynthesis
LLAQKIKAAAQVFKFTGGLLPKGIPYSLGPAHTAVSRESVRTRRSLGRHEPVMCIISPHKNSYSETFIRSHIERLPAKILLLRNGYFPSRLDDGRPLLAAGLRHRALRFASYKLLGLSRRDFQIRALKQFLRAKQVDAVLAEYGPTGASVIDSCLKANVPLIVHFHGFDAYDRNALGEYAEGYQRMFAGASAIVAVSRDMERQLFGLGAPRQKLFYSPYGVDTELFSGAEPAQSPPTFVAVGRFVEKKAPHLTLQAFKHVWERCPAARLKMIGDGELWESCKQLAEKLEISRVVEFLGPRPQLEIAAAFQQARAFVQHSIRASAGDAEGTPVSVLEAGAAGLPVVATRHNGIQDVVVEGETGLLVEEKDVEGMATHMMQLAQNTDLAGRLGDAARQRIAAEFSMATSIDRLWEIIANSAGLSGNGNERTL